MGLPRIFIDKCKEALPDDEALHAALDRGEIKIAELLGDAPELQKEAVKYQDTVELTKSYCKNTFNQNRNSGIRYDVANEELTIPVFKATERALLCKDISALLEGTNAQVTDTIVANNHVIKIKPGGIFAEILAREKIDFPGSTGLGGNHASAGSHVHMLGTARGLRSETVPPEKDKKGRLY